MQKSAVKQNTNYIHGFKKSRFSGVTTLIFYENQKIYNDIDNDTNEQTMTQVLLLDYLCGTVSTKATRLPVIIYYFYRG